MKPFYWTEETFLHTELRPYVKENQRLLYEFQFLHIFFQLLKIFATKLTANIDTAWQNSFILTNCVL